MGEKRDIRLEASMRKKIATLEAQLTAANDCTAKQAIATRKVYPTTSPKRSRVTARMGMAKKGWIKLVVESP